MSVGDRKRGVGNPRLSRKIMQPYIAAKGNMSGAEIQLDEAQPLFFVQEPGVFLHLVRAVFFKSEVT